MTLRRMILSPFGLRQVPGKGISFARRSPPVRVGAAISIYSRLLGCKVRDVVGAAREKLRRPAAPFPRM